MDEQTSLINRTADIREYEIEPNCKDDVKRIGLVVFFGTGKVFSSTGQLVYAVLAALKHFGIKDSRAVYPIAILGGASTLYVRAFTRIPALNRQFTPGLKKSREGLSLWPNSGLVRLIVVAVGSIGIVSGVVDAFQSYLGSTTIMDIMHVTEKTAQYIVGGYIVISSLGTYYAFTVNNTLENTVLLMEKLSKQQLQNSESNYCKVLLNFLKTGLVGTLGTAAFAAFAYFTVKDILILSFPSLSIEIIQILSSISFATTMVSTALSRMAETYKYFEQNEMLPFKDVDREQLAKLLPHIVMGYLDILTFSLSFYIGSVETLGDFGMNKQSLTVKLLSLSSAVSGGFLHYVFSVRPMVKTAMDYFFDTASNKETTSEMPRIENTTSKEEKTYFSTLYQKAYNCCFWKSSNKNNQRVYSLSNDLLLGSPMDSDNKIPSIRNEHVF
jgi:hypothetical protein